MDERIPFDAERFLNTVTTRPGVYKMVGRDGEVLYVGKAGNLRKRLQSYFRPGASEKQRQIVSQLGRIEVTVTPSEAEALLLESRWIKQLQPRYNVALKDDKRYPYLRLTLGHPFPRLELFRGSPREGDRCFGPYPSVGSVRKLLDQLAPIFRLRSCPDSVFASRRRPCLEYQLGRCSAPCVAKISREDYRRNVERLIALFEGEGEALIAELASEMADAAKRWAFERAAEIRDRIAALRELLLLRGQDSDRTATDVVVALPRGGGVYFYVAQFRQAAYTGGYGFLWPKLDGGLAEAVESFLGQFYLSHPRPERLVAIPPPSRPELIQELFGFTLVLRPQGDPFLKWIEMARLNAEEAVRHHLSGQERNRNLWEALRKALGLPKLERIEGFDISHLQGREMVASCVVFDPSGPCRKAYRSYLLREVPAGDDYAALRQVVHRRLRRLQEEGKPPPDLILIDGGRGQVRTVQEVLASFRLEALPVLGVVKGRRRHFSEDRFYLGWQNRFWQPEGEEILLLQQVRDEAHRFALRAQRRRRRPRSVLETVPGIGPKRRKLLLERFGGLNGLKQASRESLAQVEGIGPLLAERIYAVLHESGG